MRQFRDEESRWVKKLFKGQLLFFWVKCFLNRELRKLTAAQFMEVWEHYDEDGNLSFLLTIKQRLTSITLG